MVVMWSNDLMFKSKVRASAGASPITFVGTLEQLVTRLDEGGVSRVLVDMDVNTSDLAAAMIDIVAHANGAELVIFGSHARTDVFDAAKAAGFHRTLARSQFVKNLPNWLA